MVPFNDLNCLNLKTLTEHKIEIVILQPPKCFFLGGGGGGRGAGLFARGEQIDFT